MSDQDTLVFANRDTLFSEPVIDGFFDRDFMITNEAVETGYVGGALMTLGASGVPPVIFQGIRLAKASANEDRLILAFLCRFTQPLSSGANTIDDDEIVIALKSSFTSNNANDVRLIVINPMGSGGAQGGAGVNGSTGAANDIRNNRSPRVQAIYKSGGPDLWVPATPTNVEVKVRSWNPSPGSGAPELAWSVEVSVPRTAAGGGGGEWFDIQNDFGFYFALTRIVGVGGGAASQYIFPLNSPSFPGFYDTNPLSDFPFGHGIIPGITTPPLTTTPKGIYFMNGWQGIGCRPAVPGTGAPSHVINASGNEVVALLGNDGTTPANQIQVDFAMAHWGLPPADPNLWTRPDGLLPVKIPAGGQTVGAAATNVEFASDPWTLDDVTPNYKGSGLTQRDFFAAHPHQCMWAQASALTSGVNFRQSSVRRNMDFVGLSDVEREAEVSGEGYDEPANGTTEHDFILQTFCRRMIVQEAIDNIEMVEDETKQLLAAAVQTDRQDVDQPAAIRNTVMTHMTTGRAAGRQYRDVVVYLWITMGYRLTKHYVTVAGKQYPLLDNGSGSFGFVATHKGVKDNLSWSFAGPGFGRFGPGSYGLKVPHKGSVTIRTRLSAEPNGSVGDERTDLPKLNPKDWIPPVKDGPGRDDPIPGDGTGQDKPTKSCLPVMLALAMIPGLGLATYLTS
jgi:hypothetical protein